MKTPPNQGMSPDLGPSYLAPYNIEVGQNADVHSSKSGIPADLPYFDPEHDPAMPDISHLAGSREVEQNAGAPEIDPEHAPDIPDIDYIGGKGGRTYFGHFPHIAALTGAGLRLRLDDNRIIASPTGALTAEVRDYITAHRDAIRYELFVRGIAAKLEGVIAELVDSCLDWYRDDYSALQDMSRAELRWAVLAYLGRELWAKEVLGRCRIEPET